MKAVTRQRPKNANYSVSSNVPLNAKSRTRQPEKQPQRPKQQERNSKPEGDGGKMTKFRSLDDIPDFTDDFGKDKSDVEVVDSPDWRPDPAAAYSPPSHYHNNHTNIHSHSTAPASGRGLVPANNYSKMSNQRGPPPALPVQVQVHGPPPLPAEELSQPAAHHSEGYPLPQRRNYTPPPCFDNNSCGSVDTDLSDDDDDCNNSYFSSTDDYHVDYTPSKGGAKQNNVRLC
jgi:hypothetical protein